jgi:hypothetical protein
LELRSLDLAKRKIISKTNLFKTLAVKGEFREVKEIEGKEHA